LASFASFGVEQIWACRFPAKNSSMAEDRGKASLCPRLLWGLPFGLESKATLKLAQVPSSEATERCAEAGPSKTHVRNVQLLRRNMSWGPRAARRPYRRFLRLAAR